MTLRSRTGMAVLTLAVLVAPLSAACSATDEPAPQTITGSVTPTDKAVRTNVTRNPPSYGPPPSPRRDTNPGDQQYPETGE